MSTRYYACIDLKSFYASVECAERGLDPLDTHLVVADDRRTAKTICLAISPSLKSYGLPGRARLFEVNQKVAEINRARKRHTTLGAFLGKSSCHSKLVSNPNYELDFIIARPRMSYYIEYSSKIYQIYLQHLAPCDIFPYSIDEVFCDITDYLHYTNSSPREFVTKMIRDVYQATGITATAGIGTNLYLAKIAMDIVAKHATPDENGARIAELDEQSYRQELWSHQPITDFWRIGPGYAKKLRANGLYTMGDVARCSLNNEDFLYKLFGVSAELLIDHAWGYEPCTICEIKNYRPKNHSLSSGQVLHCPYDYDKTKLIVKEMADQLALDLTAQHLITDQIALTINYDPSSLTANPHYTGPTHKDHYGRRVPTHAHGTFNFTDFTAIASQIIAGALSIYERTVNPDFLTRRVTIVATHVIDENSYTDEKILTQLDLFTHALDQSRQKHSKDRLAAEKRLQAAILNIKQRYGSNAIFRAMNLEEGSTTLNRHRQIGGHQA